MTDFNINVIVDPRNVNRGMDVIDRRLVETESKADRLNRVLKRALTLVGIGATIRQLGVYADTYTNIQNRIRGVTESTAELVTVTDELFAISQKTRVSFQSTADLYTRTALAVKGLGISQRQTLEFTESLNQAVVLSGASAAEAGSGIMQLSQALGSNVLQGEELRAILENLPAVADVISKSMGVTRGELRKLGSEGKISAITVLNAFKDAREELAVRFAKTIPTLSQSFVVLRNSLIKTVGDIDSAFGISESLSKTIIDLAGNVESLAEALGDLSKVLIASAGAYASYQAVIKAGVIKEAISAQIAYRSAIASGAAVALGSAEAERQKSVAEKQSAVSAAAVAASTLRKARANELDAATALNSVKAVQAQLVAERSLETVRLQAQINSIGRQKSLTRLAEIRRSELALTTQLTAAETRLAQARVASSAAGAARASSLTTLAGAQKNVATTTAAAAGSTTLFAQAINSAKSALRPLVAIIAANPIAAIVASLVAATAALTLFSDDIAISSDGLITLADYGVATFNIIKRSTKGFTDFFSDNFVSAIDIANDSLEKIGVTFTSILKAGRDFVNKFIGFYVGLGAAVASIFSDIKKSTLNAIGADFLSSIADNFRVFFSYVSDLATSAIETTSKLRDIIFDAADAARKSFPELEFGGDDLVDESDIENRFGDIGKNASKAFLDNYKRDFVGELSDFVSSSLKTVNDEAAKVSAERRAKIQAEEAARAGATAGLGVASGVAGGPSSDFTSTVKTLEDQNILLGLNNNEREIQAGLLATEKQLKRELTSTEAEYVEQLLRERQALEGLPQVMDELATQEESAMMALQEQLTNQQTIIQQAMDARILTTQEGYDLMAEAARQYDEEVRALESARIESQLGDASSLFGSLADIAKQYAGEQSKTYKRLFKISKAFSIAETTMSIATSIAQAAKAPWPTNSAAMASVAASTAGLVSQIQSVQYAGEFENGGQFQVGGSGGTDSQMVSFRATPGEQVRVSTPQQEFSNNQGYKEGQSMPNVNIAFFNTPEDAQSWLDSQEGKGKMIDYLTENKNDVNSVLQG